jgi:hypothetical protein
MARWTTIACIGWMMSLAACSGSGDQGGETPIIPGDDAAPTADALLPDGALRPDTGPRPDGSPPSDTGTASDTATGSDGGGTDTATTPDSGPTSTAGNPDGHCKAGIPALGMPADVSKPTTVVGTGTAASCTFAALKAAASTGGVITFDCGSSPVTIPVTATLKLPTTKSTVIDGGNKITLDGGGAVQILRFDSPDFRANENRLTLQHLTLTNGKMTPTEAIPVHPLPCSQGWNDGEGGALYMRDGNLTIVDSIFTNNHAAPLGPDTGGGAIYVLGSKHGVVIVKSTFANNEASNAGAVGGLFAELDIYDSYFHDNKAIGNGANSDDASKCAFINNGQHEVGSGGNGGAIYNDGASVNVLLCGDKIVNNAAGVGAFGGGLFFTSNDFGGTLTITDTTMTGNTGGHWTSVASGTVTNAGTAVGTNAKSITITDSTLQGVP